MGRKETNFEFVKRVVLEIGFTFLGSECGKYFAIFKDSDDEVVVSYFEGECKFVKDLSKVAKRDIGKIAKDLRIDFE